MSQEDGDPSQQTPETSSTGVKRPYQKPSFRYEKIFETMALQCGKVQTTESSCHSNRKNS